MPTATRRALFLAAWASCVAAAAGCSKSEAATNRTPAIDVQGAAGSPAHDEGCGEHAACGDNFFVDGAEGGACAAGSICNVTFKLVAKGDFHVNDEYPYRFKADDDVHVRYEGTDPAGKNVFSKSAGDWQKVDAKTGALKVKFTALDKGPKVVAGTFKLSVCSTQSCMLEQRHVSVALVAN